MPDTSLKSMRTVAHSGFSQELLVATLDAVSDAVIVVCDQGLIRFCSSGVQRLFGYSSADLFGQSVSELIPRLNRVEHRGQTETDLVFKYASAFGEGHELVGKTKQGDSLDLHVSLGEFAGSESNMYVILARTLRQAVHQPEERAVEQERHDSRRLLRELHSVFQSVVMEELTSGVAHVVNQPLAAIATYADASRRLLKSSEGHSLELLEYLEKISSQAIRAGDAISQIRSSVPTSTFANDEVRVKDLLLELTDIIETEVHDAGLTLMLNIEDNLPLVKANAAHIQHVVLLLLRNSLESQLSVSPEIDDILISARETSKHEVEIAVTDHGSGVESENIGTMHYPFTSDSSEKIALGLSVCNTIVDKHRGRLWHELNSAGVSRFLFTLPTVRR